MAEIDLAPSLYSVSHDKNSARVRQADVPTNFNPIYPRQKICTTATKNRLVCGGLKIAFSLSIHVANLPVLVLAPIHYARRNIRHPRMFLISSIACANVNRLGLLKPENTVFGLRRLERVFMCTRTPNLHTP